MKTMGFPGKQKNNEIKKLACRTYTAHTELQTVRGLLTELSLVRQHYSLKIIPRLLDWMKLNT